MQQIIGSFIYLSRAINNALLRALNTIIAKQDAAIEQTEDKCHRVLDYVATQTKISLIFNKSDMVLTIDSYASCVL